MSISESFEGVHSSIRIDRLGTSAVLLYFSGTEIGEFGGAPMQSIEKWLTELQRIDVFVDTQNMRGASIDISGEWASWFKKHKVNLKSITVLTGSRLVQITAQFMRRFAELEGIMWLCTDKELFDLAVAQASRQ